MSNVIPENWQQANLEDLIIQMSNGANVDQLTETTNLRISRIETIWNGNIDPTRVKYIGKQDQEFIEKYSLNKNDILFSHINSDDHIGKTAIYKGIPEQLIHGINLLLIRVHDAIDADFINYQFKHLKDKGAFVAVAQRAVNQSSINQQKLKKFIFNIPPISEQKRIVQKIEELFSEIENGITSLETTQKQLNIHRQAILKSALYGELTQEWRNVNNIHLEDSNVLLNQYQKIRENDYLTKLETWKELNKKWEKDKGGVKPSKPSKLKKIVESSKNGINNFLELPTSWTYIKLGFLIEDPVYGTSKKCNYENNDGLGVLRIPNISKGFIDSTDLKFAYFSDEEIASYKLEKDDLLTIRSNGSVSLVGKTALVRSTDTDKLFAGYLIRLRPFKQHVNGKYLHYAFESLFVRNQIEFLAKSTSGVNNINSSELQSLIIPIPILEEQNIIVNKLDNLLDVNRMVSEQLEVEIKKANHLKSSILTKAFSGQLIPQDLNDEPASVLLERIKAEKEEEQAKVKANKAPKKSGKRKTEATKEDEPAQQELI